MDAMQRLTGKYSSVLSMYLVFLCCIIAVNFVGASSVQPPGCTCKDLSPPGQLTCNQQKRDNKCNLDWMVVGKFCEVTCGRCMCIFKGQDDCGCDDQAPKQSTCEQVLAENRCLNKSILKKNHCATTCDRCQCSKSNVTVSEWAESIEEKVVAGNISIQEGAQLLRKLNQYTQQSNSQSAEIEELYSLVNSPQMEGNSDQGEDMFWAYRNAQSDNDVCQDSIMNILKNSTDYTYMAQALETTGMDLVLEHTSTPHTIFVPENNAFTALAELLEEDVETMLTMPSMRKIVGYHIVDKFAYDHQGLLEIAVASTLIPDFPLFIDITEDLKLVETVGGGRAKVIEFDIPACQAIIHIIDGILSPNGPADIILGQDLQTVQASQATPPENSDPSVQFKSFPDDENLPASLSMVGVALPPLNEDQECADVSALDLLMSHPRLDHVPKAMMMYELAHTVLTDKSRAMTVFVAEEKEFLQTLEDIAVVQPMDMLTARNLILYHVIPDELLTSKDLKGSKEYVTLTNLTLSFNDDEIEAVGSTVKVLESDLGNACNVEIHIIDDILLPFELPESQSTDAIDYSYEFYERARNTSQCTDQSALQVLRTHPNLNSIEPSLVFAGMEDLFASNEVTMTVFIPHDDAFSAVVDRMVDDEDGDYGGIFDPFNRHYLKSILLYHIIPDIVVNSTQLIQGSNWNTLLTDAELQIQVSQEGGLQVVGIGKRANIVYTDVGKIGACNMIVHVIDDILLPINPTLTGNAAMDYGLMLRQSLEENDLKFQTDILKKGCDPSITPMDVMRRDPLLNAMSMSIVDSEQETVLNRVDKEATVFLPDSEGGWQLLNTILESGMPEDLLSPNNRMFWGSLFLYHVIPDVRLTSEMLRNNTGMQFSSMFNNIPITIVSDGSMGLVVEGVGNKARITSMDVSVACKVAVHVVDGVLLPFTVEGFEEEISPQPITQQDLPLTAQVPTITLPVPPIQSPVPVQSLPPLQAPEATNTLPSPAAFLPIDQLQPEAATVQPSTGQQTPTTIQQKNDQSDEDLSVILEQAAERDSPAEISCKTIGQVMESNSEISILALLMREAGLADILDKPNAGLTIIAPSNNVMVENFDFFDVLQMSLDGETDSAREFFNTMKYHIIDQQVRVEELPPQPSTLSTLAVNPATKQPLELTVSPTINPQTNLPAIAFQGVNNEAVIIGEPIDTACGSLIYPVDKMLTISAPQPLPEEDNIQTEQVKTPAVLAQKAPDTDCIPVMNLIQGHPKLSSFADLLKRAGMAGALTRGKNITVFAPDDRGLSIILEALGNNVDLLELEGLQAWMGYHVVSGKYSTDLLETGLELQTYTLSSAHEPLTFSIAEKNGGEAKNVTLIDSIGSQSRITERDLETCGGVVHVLDVPLMPVASTPENKRK